MLEPGVVAALERERLRYQKLQEDLADPSLSSDPGRLRNALRESGALAKRMQRYARYRELLALEADARSLLESESDPDLLGLAQEELETHAREREDVEVLLRRDLLARHEYSDRNVILEIRAGVGGDEATLFAADLARMYQRFAERHKMKFEVVTGQRSEVGGYKEVTLAIEGEDVYGMLRFEAGGHRVQRVPATESQGRIHTSAATVAVLAEPEDVEVQILDSDLKIDTFRAGGPGGQNVNKTSSAVRITHLPTGLVVSCQDESSQHKNRSKAMRTLRSRLFDVQQREKKEQRDSARREQIGTGDRGDKIRTYNYPQDRVTDHRIHRNFHPLPQILDGDLSEIVEALREFAAQERLRELERGGGTD